jgi:ferrous iron transport protein B
VGKSTVFNALTGLHQHVGNWPGKTVEKKVGHLTRGGREIEIVDLPGTYGLSASSEEERIAREFLVREQPQVVVAVLNAAALERSLYLLAELLALPVPVVVGLNMMDVAQQQGLSIRPEALQAALGLPVVRLVASRRHGLAELLEAATALADDPTGFAPKRPVIRPGHAALVEEIRESIADRIPAPYPEAWVALKLLEGDADISALVRSSAPDAWVAVEETLKSHEDAYLDIAGGRYDWVRSVLKTASIGPRRGLHTFTDRLDRVATHPVWGPLTLVGILGVVFLFTFTVARPAASGLGWLISGPLATGLRHLLASAPSWLSGVLVDGVLAGAGTVLSFIPILVVFFAALGVLEDTGYMARGAYVMDRYMHRMGLHGKSCMPLVLGFGCNVPAVMGTRIIEERRARFLTILLAPFVPCTGRLAVLAFLVPAFFAQAAPLVAIGLVAGNLVLLGVVGIAVNRVVYKGERAAFVMEMPLYHRPNGRTIGLFVWRNVVAFLRKAGSIIVIVSAVIWLLTAIPGGGPEHSVLAMLARPLAPAASLLGLGDWRLVMALISSFVAKENSVATLGILFAAGGTGGQLAARLTAVLTPAAALAFLVVQMTFIPCVATVAAIRHETRSWRWVAYNLGLMLAVSFLAGTLVYQVGSRL